ncbi:ATP-binding response regulator [Maridesulfovibrio hydrothermalis]|uniref:histidine kinase n=1 Tax=Maridesulfovibrio hydrothermalis AM13 = DSM 14728 TaxID=1121451 RepID=L0RE66_9BACT|nr:hybrid sensor histidine kinase/response regulator [Maridesulfovibrio hydrothermalis]CCO25088.1 Response regulator receiver sensor signal transduction histidine kinase [Maridesulfovibrio hydrothermalis AM13 = DSM 14728]
MQKSDIFNDDELLFSGEESEEVVLEPVDPWLVLIVDDEPDIHSMTKMVLGDYIFEGRSLEFISAYTGEESLGVMGENTDIAVVLLDVVMETNTAGLEVAGQIRDMLNNQFIRIILRTGQPGYAPEYKVITELDINDYWQKAELTSQRLTTSMTTALRSYRDLRKIEQNRVSLAQLAMSVAHQIRNRTMTINGFANLASRKLGPQSEAAEYLATISEESGRLEKIVDSVSSFAAISSCDHSEVDIKIAAEEVLSDIKIFAATFSKKVDIDVQLEHVLIDAKPDLFKKVLEELLKNAVLFSDEENPLVKLVVRADSDVCSIDVIDNGSGVDAVDLPYIFDPFFTKHPEAVGMGLSIVNRIVSGYNWSVNVLESDSGGAVFSLRIPL